jgi:beta-galactosidase/beta-glucuronidase
MILIKILFLLLSRYSHAMGNSNGNIDAYWMAIDNTFGLQGGFIWDWVDEVSPIYFHPLLTFV